MSKHARVAAFVKTLEEQTGYFHPCYEGYFQCFNDGDYYEAHDVLEHLWLDCRDSNHLYFKGLIQIAGAFVHLKKQHARPHHPTDGRRLFPAVRLFSFSIHFVRMKRDLYADLCAWKGSGRRKPLILRGARQVGKTHLLKEFGNKEYSGVAYFNFEEDPRLKGFFTGRLNPTALIEALGLYRNEPIKAGEDLIIFDEIQASNEALNALK